ncbi:MAG TPA: hypothetical protein PLM72_06300 [Spirochaetota bacterium]|jgi:hypothetical protein|nr:hypothetical protein [Spirochaetota bacterium]HPJ15151.1 hypothetical protein [Spirochaetota bacterium]HQO22671.1 hypothetical protein [Spirochaetota bacterium]
MIASGLRLAKYFLFYSLFALLAVIILLIAKGGDSSFYAGFILFITGMISSCISLIITLGTLIKKKYSSSEKIPLFIIAVSNVIYLILCLISILFALLLFCSLSRL